MTTISTAARNAAADAITALLNVGGAGSIKFYTSGAVLLATCPLSATSFGAAAAGVATANAITADSSADANGTADNYAICNNAGTVVITGTVGTSGTDFVFNTVAWTIGDNISVTALTLTMPAT